MYLLLTSMACSDLQLHILYIHFLLSLYVLFLVFVTQVASLIHYFAEVFQFSAALD